MAAPKAVLAELVAVALLAPVPEAHHALAAAVGALHGVEDCGSTQRAGRGGREGIFIWRNQVNTGENQTSRTQAKVETELEAKILNCLLVNGTCHLLE